VFVIYISYIFLQRSIFVGCSYHESPISGGFILRCQYVFGYEYMYVVMSGLIEIRACSILF